MTTRTCVGVGGESYECGTWEAALLMVRSKVAQHFRKISDFYFHARELKKCSGANIFALV